MISEAGVKPVDIGSSDDANMKRKPPCNVVYVITGHAGLNDRVKKVVDLQVANSRIVLIAPNVGGVACETLAIEPYGNPTGILRVAGLPRVKRAVDRFLFFPSTRVLYVKPLLRILKGRIARDIEQGSNVALLICVPPHDMCLVGLTLKRDFPRLFWMIDWQDLWSYDENYYERTPRLYRPRLLRLEKQILAECDLNITTNSYAKAVLEENFDVASDKVVAIPHHFSSDDLDQRAVASKARTPSAESSAIRVGFLGTLFKPPRVPGDLMHDAIREFNASGLRAELHVHGNYPKHATDDALARMRDDGLFFHGPSSHEESLQKLLPYDYLLLLLADLPNSRAVMSIKLPHYMLIGIPIIAVVPDRSAVADALRQTGTGYVVPINGDWRRHLRRIFDGKDEHQPRRNAQAIEAYSWDNLSSDWKTLFTRAAVQPLRN